MIRSQATSLPPLIRMTTDGRDGRSETHFLRRVISRSARIIKGLLEMFIACRDVVEYVWGLTL